MKKLYVAIVMLLMTMFFTSGCCKRTLFLDTFSTNQLSSGYQWFDQGTVDTYHLGDGHLRIAAHKRQDLWGGIPIKRGAPLMLRPAPAGDYWVETFVRTNPANIPQPLNTQIGLFVFQDVNNWIFFGLTHDEFSAAGDGLLVTSTVGNVSNIVAGQALAEDFVFLKIKKSGNDWRCYWKLHQDDPWNLLTTVNLALANYKIGVGVKTFDLQNPSKENAAQAKFDFFRIRTQD